MPHVICISACAASSTESSDNPGTIQSGLASIAVPELEIWRDTTAQQMMQHWGMIDDVGVVERG
jgi:hypothetical protein